MATKYPSKFKFEVRSDGYRRCIDCGEFKSPDQFHPPKSHRSRNRCLPCDSQHRRLIEKPQAALRPARRYECLDRCGRSVSSKGRRCMSCHRVRTKIHAQEKTMKLPPNAHLCQGACGTILFGKIPFCQTCKKNRQDIVALNSQRNLISHRTLKALQDNRVLGVMWIGEDVLSLNYSCPNCNKPVLFQSRCYQCSVGYPRNLTVLPKIVYSKKALSAGNL